MLKGANQFSAETYVNMTGNAGAFAKVEGFSLRIGSKDFVYHNSLDAATNTKWSTPTSFSTSKEAFNALALDYPGTKNFAQMKFSVSNYGVFVKGTAAPQGSTLGGGTQLMGTSASFKAYVKRVVGLAF